MRLTFTTVLLSAILFCSCSRNDRLLELSLEMAGDNRSELESVIEHYADEPLKREAAEWLIANMPGHSVVWSDGIQAFADSVMLRPLPQQEADRLWDSLQNTPGAEVRRKDIEAINAEFLIGNIDRAFEAWHNSPWRDEVDFDRFKKYVLPYRVSHELLRHGWRDSLIKTYSPTIKNAKTAKEAFELLRKEINSTKRSAKYKFPHLLDAVALRNHYSGVCLERCVYLANVCRALGLPVTIDNCGRWANYSDSSHTWVALILEDGTYTIIDEDSIARKDNAIDASTFKLNQAMPAGYPYTSEFRKRLVKAWRQTFHLNPVETMPKFKGELANRLSSPRLVDVSQEYGISGSVSVKPDKETEHVWLCTHALTSGWIPQAYSKVSRGRARFDNISDSVLMLPMGILNGKEVAAGLPFYISDGNKIEIKPDMAQLTSATFTRKYPMNAGWLNRYSQIPGARLEGSDNLEFSNPDTLFIITQTPVFFNSATIRSDKPYRYFRIFADLPSYANMSMFNIYDKDGSIITSEAWTKKGYIDLGTPAVISKVEYFPWNDGNFVVPGHEYRLDFWNGAEWQLIQSQISNGYELTFSGIPSGALLLLHDLTEGKEERPFTLNEGKQVWW